MVRQTLRCMFAACAFAGTLLVGAPTPASAAAAAAAAAAPPRDPYGYCSTAQAVNVRLDGGFASDWMVPERPAGAYPDGSVEAISRANVYAADGMLHLAARKTNDNGLGDLLARTGKLNTLVMRNATLRNALASRFTSGRVMGRLPIRFGCIEITARLPKGRGYWPALWLRTPYAAPFDGEIDLVEGFGSHPGVFQSTLHHWRNGREPKPRIIGGVDRTYTCARVVAAAPRPPADTQTAIKKARWAGTDRYGLPRAWISPATSTAS